MAIFDVTTLADSGAGSLRQAIADANATAGADTITFASAVTGTISLTSGDINITDDLTIQGPGAGVLSVNANLASRIFYIYNPAVEPIDVTISSLTLTRGYKVVTDDTVASRGGAINAKGENLTIENAIVEHNSAAGDGGGIASTNAALHISDTIIRHNHAYVGNRVGGDGGGVFADGSTGVTLNDISFDGNSGAYDGGALHVSAPQTGAVVTIADSILHENAAGSHYLYDGPPYPDHSGGGFSFDSVPDFTVRRTTMSGNGGQFGGSGGKIVDSQGLIENATFFDNYSYGLSPGGGLGITNSNVTISHSTFAQNYALGRGTPDTRGNGIHAVASTVDVSNSIIANGNGDDLYTEDGATIALRYSYVRDQGAATIQDDGGNVIDPPGMPLATSSCANALKLCFPLPVAVNAGDPAFTPPPSTDQRGFSRVGGGRIDMGAIELNTGTVQFAADASSVLENGGPLIVTLTRTGGIDGAVTATFSPAGNTATPGSDFSAAPTIDVSWPSGDGTPKTASITIHDDATYEGDETFTLQITQSSGGASIGTPSTQIVTITENDPMPADLAVTKTIDETAPYSLGQVVTFRIAVTNAGPADATDVVVTDVLPDGLTYVSSMPAGACTGAPEVVCSVGTIADGATSTITIRARLDSSGDFTNSASVSSPTADEDATDDSDAVAFAVPAAALTDVPALDSKMLSLLTALIAALAIGVIGKR